MRPAAALALSLFVVSSVYGQPFPAPITPELPVAAVEGNSAAGMQNNPQMATSGEVTLVTWVDAREGFYAVYGTRVDTAGNVLDPMGVRLATGYLLNTVAWNGESFVVIVGTNFTLVSPDLKTITTKELPLPQNTPSFVAATTGADPRFLFFLGQGAAAIIDARGNVVVQEHLDAAQGGFVLAGGNDNSFLLLRNNLAHHIDRNGNVLSIVDANISDLGIRQFGKLVGGPDGFLLAGVQGSENQPEVAVHWFNASGVRTGSRVLSPAAPSFAGGLSVAREANRYVVVWMMNDIASGKVTEYAASVGLDISISASFTASAQIAQGRGLGMSIVSGHNGRFVATALGDDIYIQSLPEMLQPPMPALVTRSGAMQQTSSIAAGANGYALLWIEYGTDPLIQRYVRRVSANGELQDPAPIPVASSRFSTAAYMQATIVSNGQTYLVGWQTESAFLVRRLDAMSGEWIDSEPLSLGMIAPVSLASNGTDFLAFGSTSCGDARCLTTRRISMTGAPLVAPPVNVRTLGAHMIPASLTLASNGTDYMAISFESPICMFDPCLPNPGPIFATRLRADGTAIDAQPIKLSATDRVVVSFSVAWSDGRYLVAWSELDGVRGTRITDQGAVLDRDLTYGGVLLVAAKATELYSLAPVAAGIGRRFAILVTYATRVDNLPAVAIDGIAFDARAADLTFIPAQPRTAIAPAVPGYYRNLAAAGRGYTLAAAYDRPTADAGNVSRAVLRLFAEPNPRRRATH